MAGRFRRGAEKVVLLVTAATGIGVVVLDLVGLLDKMASGDLIPKVTLIVLSSVTVFLLFEIHRLQALDKIEQRLAGLDIQALAETLKHEHYAGLVKVHHQFSDEHFGERVCDAKQVTILNTWIPNLENLERDILNAVNKRAEVRIMLLHPNSMVTGLRNDALRDRGVDRKDDHVKTGIKHCLDILETLQQQVNKRRLGNLKVRVYNSLPSVSVYRADDHYLVGVFLHRQLAIHSPQFEIVGAQSVLGQSIQRELDTLWGIGKDVDLKDWPRSIDINRADR
ncbi:hypothetical protein [Herbihabitans rhizosphaerae]|uniref:hypothetical protein n=1 Tax=Herbihabitans rhizosphaerae TaxID=1872711 RepID=UPI001F5F959F|nr:hypothetical protein [Herbihabitans rhizosphaerae]